jgi:hypothetical protein
MSITYKQDQDFIRAMIPSSLLDEAIYWMACHLDPEDVFGPAALEMWAEDNGYERK